IVDLSADALHEGRQSVRNRIREVEIAAGSGSEGNDERARARPGDATWIVSLEEKRSVHRFVCSVGAVRVVRESSVRRPRGMEVVRFTGCEQNRFASPGSK